MEKDNKQLKPKPAVEKKKKAETSVNQEQKAGSAKKKKAITEVWGSARFVHISPKKVRLVINQLKGLTALAALDLLRFTRKSSVLPVAKLINSALANAEHNFQIDKDDLFIKKFLVNAGPVIKRFRPRAHGRAAAIRKGTSHIELVLGVPPGAKIKIAEIKEVKAPGAKIVKPDEIKKEPLKITSQAKSDTGSPRFAGEAGKKEKSRGFLKGF